MNGTTAVLAGPVHRVNISVKECSVHGNFLEMGNPALQIPCPRQAKMLPFAKEKPMPDGTSLVVSRADEGRRTQSPRSLAERIMVAFHQACDQSDIEAAEALIRIAEQVVARGVDRHDNVERRRREGLVAGYERLWSLKHFDDLMLH